MFKHESKICASVLEKKMAGKVDFRVGTEFQSHADFLKRYEEYSAQEFCNFRVETSVTLAKDGNASQEDIAKFYYKSAKFVCKFYGKPRNTVEPQNRVRSCATYRQNCEAFFLIGYRQTANGPVLRITKLNENHPHVRSENL